MGEWSWEWIPLFKFWCQKIIPLIYDNSMSYYEQLCKVAEFLNQVIAQVDKNSQQIEVNINDIKDLQNQLNGLLQEFDKVKNGDYVELYINALASWIDNNLQELVGRVVKYIFFGLTDDGYFIAYIPDSWNFISFDTIIQPENPLYGHLLLQW